MMKRNFKNAIIYEFLKLEYAEIFTFGEEAILCDNQYLHHIQGKNHHVRILRSHNVVFSDFQCKASGNPVQ